jgi:alpha-beta hydrolase superfamily lysophospholipase
MFKNLTIDKKFINESLSSNENIKGVVTISHGMAEHMHRYSWLIKHFNSSGYHVVSADHIGHGSYIDHGGLPGYFGEGHNLDNIENNLVSVLEYTHQHLKYL